VLVNGGPLTASSRHFCLPTEAEWEYAARGGKNSHGYVYSGSDEIGDVAWYEGNSGKTTHIVGTKKANELGIYDMSGNVLEMCADLGDNQQYGDAVMNVLNPLCISGGWRMCRGGSYSNYANNPYYMDCRVSNRATDYSTDVRCDGSGWTTGFPCVGFRVRCRF
jgi:formylglycine-generating enzyme required for sulfatase activity